MLRLHHQPPHFWVPRTPLLVGSLPTPAPNKMDGNRNPAHFPTVLPWEPCTFCQATPNKHHNKQKRVISQEAGWNPIYPLFKRFFWTFKLLYFHYFPTIEHHNWKSNPQTFLAFDEQGTVYQELLHWSIKYTMEKTMLSCVNLPMSCEQRPKPWAHIPRNTDCFMTASLYSKHEGFFPRQCQPHNALVVLRQNDLSSCKAVGSKMHAYWGEGW